MCVCDPNIRISHCRNCKPKFDASAQEPAPVPTNEPSIHDLVIADVQARKEFGLAKYGTLLQTSNGRDPLMDAYQEVLDLCCYLRQELERRRPIMRPDDVLR